MAQKECPSCRGLGRTTRYKGVLVGNESSYDVVICYICSGKGYITIKEPGPSVKGASSPSSNHYPPKSSVKIDSPSIKSGSYDVVGFFGLIGFVVGASVTYKQISENWLLVGIGGLVLATIFFYWYKQIITIALIVGAIYLFATS